MSELRIDVSLALGPRQLRLALETRTPGTALVGPSGAGKSTLLRVIAGVERRALGHVSFGDQVWQGKQRFVPPWERRIGWVPQDGVLFPHLSVLQNLEYGARLDVRPIAALLGVDHLLDRRPRHLSGGERQRVALGRAMASAPQLLLLDEPFSALERPLRLQLAAALAQWCQVQGTPVLVVSHDLQDVRELVDGCFELRGDGMWPVDLAAG
jgi:molybdate transport system ATP-binding protein